MTFVPGSNAKTDWIYIFGNVKTDGSVRLRADAGVFSWEERVDGQWCRIATLDESSQTIDSERTIWVNASYGDDDNDGRSQPKSVQTLADALTKAAALTPTALSPVTILDLEGSIYSESVIIPANIVMRIPASAIVGSSAAQAAVQLNGNALLDCYAVQGGADNQAAVEFNGASLARLDCDQVVTTNAGSIGVKFIGSSANNQVISNFIQGQLKAIENLSTSSTGVAAYFNTTTLRTVASNAIGIHNNGSNDICGNIAIIEALAGSSNTAIYAEQSDVCVGVAQITGFDDSITVDSGAVASVRYSKVNGDITVNSGGKLLADITDFTGTITGVDNIDGMIDGEAYGTHSNYKHAYSSQADQTATTTAVEVLNVTTGTLPADDYTISVNFGYEMSSVLGTFNCEAQANSADISGYGPEIMEASGDNGPNTPVSKKYDYTLASDGTINFTMDIYRTGIAGTALIRDIYVEIERARVSP